MDYAVSVSLEKTLLEVKAMKGNCWTFENLVSTGFHVPKKSGLGLNTLQVFLLQIDQKWLYFVGYHGTLQYTHTQSLSETNSDHLNVMLSRVSRQSALCIWGSLSKTE